MRSFYAYILALLAMSSLCSCSKDYYEPEECIDEVPRPRPVPHVFYIYPPVDDD